MNLDIGSTLELEVSPEFFTARAALKAKRKRYSLKELLQGVTPNNMAKLNEKTKWARKGKPVGREIT